MTPVDSVDAPVDEEEPDEVDKMASGDMQLARRKSHKPPSFVSAEHQKAMAGQSLGQAHRTIQKELR